MILTHLRAIWKASWPTQVKCVALAICDHINEHGDKAFPGIILIAKKTSASRSTVIRCIQYLEDAKVIRVTRVNGLSNAYDWCHADTGVTVEPVSRRHRTSVRVTPPPVSPGHPNHPDEPSTKSSNGNQDPFADLPKAATTHAPLPMPPRNFSDFLAIHPRCFIGREERQDWEAIFRLAGFDELSKVYLAVCAKNPTPARIFRNLIADYLEQHYDLRAANGNPA